MSSIESGSGGPVKVERKLETIGDYHVFILDIEAQIRACKNYLTILDAGIETLELKKENSDGFFALDQSRLDTKLHNKILVKKSIEDYEKMIEDAELKMLLLKSKISG